MPLPSFTALYTQYQFRHERQAFYEDLAESLDELGNIKDFLLARIERYKTSKQLNLAALYQKILAMIGKNSLSYALSFVIPKEEVMILSAAEATGDTVMGLRFLVNKITNDREMFNSMMSASIVPFILISALVGLYAWIGSNFLPLLDQLFPHQFWNTMATIFYWVSYTAYHFGIIIYGLIIILFALWWWSLANWGERGFRTRRLLDFYPHYRIYRQIQSASLLVMLSALLESNVALKDALLRIQQNAVPYLKCRLQIVLNSLVQTPDNPGLSLENSGLFESHLATRLIEYGKRTNFDEAIQKIGLKINESTLRSVKRDAKLVGVVGLIVVGFAVGFAFLNIILLPSDATTYLKSHL